MDAQELRNLQEAYMEVVMNELDEGKSSRPRYPGGRGVLDQETRDEKREAHVENRKGHTAGPGTVTKNPKKLRKQKAMGEIGENFDIYDIILSHLLDEGYAETLEEAEWLMANELDAEDIKAIIETRMDPRGRPSSGPMNVYAKNKPNTDPKFQAALQAVRDADAKKTPEQRQKELDAYKARQANR